MLDSYTPLLDEWSILQSEASASPRLLQLKQFRDDYLCLPVLQGELSDDPTSVISTQYPLLRIQDIYHHVSKSVQDVLAPPPDASYESKRLIQALNIDIKARNLFRSLAPLHSGWRTWRARQIQRFASEDSSDREKHIMHIPFAVELTQGCSGGCSFCGLSASYLEDSDSSFQNAGQAFSNFLSQMMSVHGEFAKCGILYWASDPLDCIDYLHYATSFREVFNVMPSTTTALAAKYPLRFKAYIDSGGLTRPWGLRCSLRSVSEYIRIKEFTSITERFSISFLPQYRSNTQYQAIAGRSYTSNLSDNQQSQGGTIACMSGLLVSLPRFTVELVTPCLAEPNHQNGYRSLVTLTANSLVDLNDCVESMLSRLPIIPVDLSDSLRVTIHPTQYKFYRNDEFPDLLDHLSSTPLSLQQLIEPISDRLRIQRILAYCMELIQFGVLKVSIV